MDYINAIDFVAQSAGFKNKKRYITRCNFLFNSLIIKNKRVLDIGCGTGEFALWCALHNAEYVLGIEPEKDGAASGSYQVFQNSIKTIGMENIEARDGLFEDLSIEKPFDVIILNNVINHLNETAVRDLHKNQQSYEIYIDIARKLANLLAPGGVIILADCARKNFWNDISLRSPFAPMIEWNKHQNPGIWKKIFLNAGFKFMDVRWSPLYPLGKITSNFFIHYITISHFVLRFTKPERR